MKRAKDIAIQLRLDLKQALKSNIGKRLEGIEEEPALSGLGDYDDIVALQKEVKRLQDEQAKAQMQRESVEQIKADLEVEIKREIMSSQNIPKSTEDVLEEKAQLAKQVQNLKELLKKTTADMAEAKSREKANLDSIEALEKELELLRSEKGQFGSKSSKPAAGGEDLVAVKRELQEQRELAERTATELKTLKARELATLKQSNDEMTQQLAKTKEAKAEFAKKLSSLKEAKDQLMRKLTAPTIHHTDDGQ